MRVVVDASVFVSAARLHEAGHRSSLDFLHAISQQGDELFAPALLFPEIAGAIARPTQDPERARDTIALIKTTTNIREIAVDQELSGRAADIAAKGAPLLIAEDRKLRNAVPGVVFSMQEFLAQ